MTHEVKQSKPRILGSQPIHANKDGGWVRLSTTERLLSVVLSLGVLAVTGLLCVVVVQIAEMLS